MKARRRAIVAGDLFRLRFIMAADLSPDARTAVYVLSRSDLAANRDAMELFVVDIDSGRSRLLVEDPAMIGSPSFSADGRALAFMSMRSGAPQIFVIPAAGGEVVQLTSLRRGVGGGPVWSPDGKRIAFTAGKQGEPRDPAKPYRVSRTIWRADGVGLIDDAIQQIHVVDAAGGEARALTDDAALNHSPVWTADSQGLIYAAAFDPVAAPMATTLRIVIQSSIAAFCA